MVHPLNGGVGGWEASGLGPNCPALGGPTVLQAVARESQFGAKERNHVARSFLVERTFRIVGRGFMKVLRPTKPQETVQLRKGRRQGLCFSGHKEQGQFCSIVSCRERAEGLLAKG